MGHDEDDEVRELRRLIDSAERIVFFGGAGVSTESGIPDFRSEAGLYNAQREYGHRPETILSADFLQSDPGTFFRYYFANLVHPHATPGSAHRALAALERRGQLTHVITQNIDGLHTLAGSRSIIELHGSGLRNYCIDCGRTFTLDAVMSLAGVTLELLDGAAIPRCDCSGIVRPDVVLYGEPLSDGVVAAAVRAIEAADLLVVGGTSLSVYPAAGLIRSFQGEAMILINLTATPADYAADVVIRRPIGETLAPFVA